MTYMIGSELVTFSPAAPPELAGRTERRWYVANIGDGRKVIAGIADREAAEHALLDREAGELPVEVRFADGSVHVLPFDLSVNVVGLDGQGDVIVRDPACGFTYLLTRCCYASGKGSYDSMSGVVCRKCYRDVGHIYGMTDPDLAVPVLR